MPSKYTETTAFMLTKEQKQQITSKAHESQVSMGEYIRSVLFPSVKSYTCEPIPMEKPTLDPWVNRSIEKLTIHVPYKHRRELNSRAYLSGVSVSRYVNNVLFPRVDEEQKKTFAKNK